MMIETQDQAYEFFVQEATELLQILEQGLMTLSQVHDMQKLHELMRAAHSIKGGAACVGLMGIQSIAHDLENGIRALYAEETVFDLELEELLLQAFDCLRSPIVEQIETGVCDETAAINRSKPIFEQLEAKLGHSLEEAAELPEVPMEGDMTAFLFEEEVPSGLRRWENVLKAADEAKIIAELRTQAEVFSTLGSMLGLSGFTAIAETVLQALEANPQACCQMGQIALKDLWASREAVLAGDRAIGGQASESLIQFTRPMTDDSVVDDSVVSESDEADPQVDDVSDLFILPPLQETAPAHQAVSLPELLLQGLECLRLPLLEQIETGHWQAERTIQQLHSIVAQLEEILGYSLEAITQASVEDSTLLHQIKSQNQTQVDLELKEEFTTQLAVFVTLGQMLDQPQLSTLASTSINTLETHPQELLNIALLAFTGIYTQQKAIWQELGILTSAFSNFEQPIDQIEQQSAHIVEPESDLETPSQLIDLSQSSNNIEQETKPTNLSESISEETHTEQIIYLAEDNIEEIDSELYSFTIEETDIDELEHEITDSVSEAVQDEAVILETHSEAIKESDIADSVSEELLDETVILETQSESIQNRDIADSVSEKLQHETQLESIEIEAAELTPETEDLDSVLSDNSVSLTQPNLNEAQTDSDHHLVEPERIEENHSPTTPIKTQLSLGVRVDINRLDQLNNLVGELATQDNSLLLQNQKKQDAVDLLEKSREKFRKLSVDIQSRGRFIGQQKQSNSRIKSEANALAQSVQETLEELDQIRASIYDMKLLNLQSQQIIKKRQQTLQRVQKNLTETRMIPMESLLNRFPRMIRDLSVRTQKKIRLELTGEKTLIDKAILEKLYDPLVHLVRNAFDHGIEPSEVRLQRGKPPEGKIDIKAYHQGNYTYIEVSDDGQGIDVNKIRNKAIALQLISFQDAARLSQKQLYDFLFYPGFSTTDKVSELSGRGVGLEAVRHQLEALKGTITIHSELEKGTRFTLRLPWTLTITKLLVFRVENSLFSIPMDALAGIVSVSATEIKTDETSSDRPDEQPRKIYDWYGQNVPLVQSLLQEYHHPSATGLIPSQTLKNSSVSLSKKSSSKVMLLLISQGLETIALKIDQILMEQNLTIKPFNKILAAPPFCYGCTILGDGRLVPVVDSPELLEHWRQQQQSQLETLTFNPDQPKLIPDSKPTVLVIDDSLTTRASLSSTLQKAGYEVLQAKQGRDGLNQLKRHSQIQVVICDLEMPEMNGFEFLTHCRREYSRDELPVIILTSRNNDRHRQLAKQLGSNEYLTKPWKEEELMQTLQQLQTQPMAMV
ncbi:MAG: response regulator [Microcoleaceae cyanobacterium]